ncbi:LOW QUALITY PROTEIN: hypothetical protein U9M48_003918 [Paspalum notatum var. saurae]|uniref:RNase H type-1 domain-containing protein n=1 Tax=Paspalum notatum var. saurae TaxID=547442 RepID=A0AAQ3PJ55_PASNO
MQKQVQQILEVELSTFEAKYLGLPTPSGHMKGSQFQPLKERLRKRLIACSEKHLSAAGKEVLIKSVAQALPTYAMGVFKLPLGFCDDLTSIIRDFWWGSEAGKRKTAWTAWQVLTLKKCQGGLGFRDMRAFNQAMLARQAWRLLEKPESLCAKLLKARYYPRGSVIDSVRSANASVTWQAVLHGLELLKQGLIWRIGNGSQVRIWRGPWIPRDTSRRVSSRRGRCRLHWVAELLNQQGSDWDHASRYSTRRTTRRLAVSEFLFSRWRISWLGTVRKLVFLQLGVHITWPCALGVHKMQQAPAMLQGEGGGGRCLWSNIWNGSEQPKVKVFTWKLCKDILPTRRNKFLRTLEKDSTCEICGLIAESSYHVVVECSAAHDLRIAMRDHWSLPPEKAWRYTGPDWLLVLLDTCNKVQRDLVKLLLWQAWNWHNNITHATKHTSLYDSVSRKEPDLKGKGKCPGEDDRGRGGIGGRNGQEAVGFQSSGWSKPAAGWTKINVDGSFVARSGKAGVGVVARDHTGAIIFTVLFGCTSAEEAEAKACIEGLRLATQWSYGPVVLKSDCARLVKAL